VSFHVTSCVIGLFRLAFNKDGRGHGGQICLPKPSVSFSGKNFGAVCSGVVCVPLDELLPPPVPLASLVLGCARPMAE
jgi:hypothetical protein